MCCNQTHRGISTENESYGQNVLYTHSSTSQPVSCCKTGEENDGFKYYQAFRAGPNVKPRSSTGFKLKELR